MSSSFLKVDKDVLKYKGAQFAVFVSFLIDKYEYFEKGNKLIDGEFFYMTAEKIQEEIGVSPPTQAKILKELKENGLIKIKRKGMPAKLLFSSSYQNFYNLLPKFLEPILEYNKTKYNKTKENNINNIIYDFPEKVIVDYWNSFSNLTTHKINSSSKILKESSTYIKELKSGTFGKNKTISHKFLETHNIPIDSINKKFTEEEIKKSIQRYSLLASGKYGFKTKTSFITTFPIGVQKNLNTFLFNRFTKKYRDDGGTSFFLLCFYKEPVNINDTASLVKIPFDSGYYERFEKIISSNYKPFDYSKKIILVNNILKVINKHKMFMRENRHRRDMSFFMTFGYNKKPENFFNTYINWLRDRFQNFPISPNMIGPSSNCWKEFVEFLKEEYRVEIETLA